MTTVPKLSCRIIARLPHDPKAFTQGLLFAEGSLFESTGRYGSSSLRRIDPRSGTVLTRRSLPAALFGEGLAFHDGQLIQLTWKKGSAFVYRAADFTLQKVFSYGGEGWGLTVDAKSFYMSDGSSAISVRSLSDFKEKRKIHVHVGQYEVAGLNELEMAKDGLYANIWKEEIIVRIDPDTGAVTGYIDTSLFSWPTRPCDRGEEVANGIAYDSIGDLFYLTGKNWPHIFVAKLSE